MAKKAYLVYTTLVTRVVANENSTIDELASLASEKIIEKINNDEIAENISDVFVDSEVPYNPEYDD